MQSLRPFVSAVLLVTVSVVLCGAPQLAQAQQSSESEPSLPLVDTPGSHQQPPSPTGTSADPSQAPPVPMANAPAPQMPTSEPVGTATAERTPTAGGAASEPAGTAIAPAKQRQVRSLLIKLGAVAGAGVALGTVMALSKGTPSTPPGASRSTAGR